MIITIDKISISQKSMIKKKILLYTEELTIQTEIQHTCNLNPTNAELSNNEEIPRLT